jgi:chemotaxis protein methyltransferase CheR
MGSLPSAKPLLIPPGLPNLLRDLIHERVGIFFDPTRIDVMFDKLDDLARAQGCQSFLDYYFILKYGENSEAEWGNAINALSVQETYFWREMSQITALVETVVPNWFARRNEPLKIWSAACATGEEPYSIAMALEEKGLGHWPIEIVGSDASEAALTKARAANYRERAFRSLPTNLKEKYFTRQRDAFELRPEIKRRVSFQKANLVAEAEIQKLATAPVIFCRNVFIYFSPETIRRTLAIFSANMPTQGNLFVGSSESLLKLTDDFELEEISDAFVYVRRATAQTSAA